MKEIFRKTDIQNRNPVKMKVELDNNEENVS